MQHLLILPKDVVIIHKNRLVLIITAFIKLTEAYTL